MAEIKYNGYHGVAALIRLAGISLLLQRQLMFSKLPQHPSRAPSQLAAAQYQLAAAQ